MTKKARLEIYNAMNGRCGYCGNKIEYKDMNVDHIVPKRRGSSDGYLKARRRVRGSDDRDNLMCSCRACNYNKHTFSVECFRKELEAKVDRLRRDNSTFRLVEKYGIVKEMKTKVEFYFETKDLLDSDLDSVDHINDTNEVLNNV